MAFTPGRLASPVPHAQPWCPGRLGLESTAARAEQCPQTFTMTVPCSAFASQSSAHTLPSLNKPRITRAVAAAGAGLLHTGCPSVSGLSWGRFWGFPPVLLPSCVKQELRPPWGDVKSPLGLALRNYRQEQASQLGLTPQRGGASKDLHQQGSASSPHWSGS